jgi:DNA-binding transcriptional ArsR family regulator
MPFFFNSYYGNLTLRKGYMPSKYKQIEEHWGKPMAVILCELYDKHRNTYKVAEELGVTQPTVSNWIMRCRLEFRTILAIVSAPVTPNSLDAYPQEALEVAS